MHHHTFKNIGVDNMDLTPFGIYIVSPVSVIYAKSHCDAERSVVL